VAVVLVLLLVQQLAQMAAIQLLSVQLAELYLLQLAVELAVDHQVLLLELEKMADAVAEQVMPIILTWAGQVQVVVLMLLLIMADPAQQFMVAKAAKAVMVELQIPIPLQLFKPLRALE
jgi:hypothetical protein